MSIVGGEEPQDDAQPEPPHPADKGKYGGLKTNNKARGRRGKVAFFDSADWAMRNQNQQGNQGQDAEGNLPRANFQQIPSDQGDGDGNSVLTNDSPLDPEAEKKDDGNSPLAGSPLV